MHHRVCSGSSALAGTLHMQAQAHRAPPARDRRSLAERQALRRSSARGGPCGRESGDPCLRPRRRLRRSAGPSSRRRALSSAGPRALRRAFPRGRLRRAPRRAAPAPAPSAPGCVQEAEADEALRLAFPRSRAPPPANAPGTPRPEAARGSRCSTWNRAPGSPVLDVPRGTGGPRPVPGTGPARGRDRRRSTWNTGVRWIGQIRPARRLPPRPKTRGVSRVEEEGRGAPPWNAGRGHEPDPHHREPEGRRREDHDRREPGRLARRRRAPDAARRRRPAGERRERPRHPAGRRPTGAVYEVLLDGLPLAEAVRKTELKFLDLVPASKHLVGAELELAEIDGRESAAQAGGRRDRGRVRVRRSSTARRRSGSSR